MPKFNRPSMAEEEMNRQMADILQQNRTAKANDIYCNGGILDALNFNGVFGYYVPSVNDRKNLLENSFVLSELRFVSAFRLLDATDVDIDKMIAFLNKWKEIIAANPIHNDGPFMRPSPNPWSPGTYIQPQTPTLSWPVTLGGESEPNVPDDEDTDKEKTPSVLKGYCGDPFPVRGQLAARKKLAEHINELTKSANKEDTDEETTKDDE